MLNVIILSVIMLSVVVVSAANKAIMLGVIKLSVMTPSRYINEEVNCTESLSPLVFPGSSVCLKSSNGNCN
jgi:hypothetical protein